MLVCELHENKEKKTVPTPNSFVIYQSPFKVLGVN